MDDSESNHAISRRSGISGERITRKEELLIQSYWGEITQFLAPPRIAWSWADVGLSHRVNCRLNELGVIRRAPGGNRWMTTHRLWRYVLRRAADDESVGVEAGGQQLFVDIPRKTQSSCVLRRPEGEDQVSECTKQTTLSEVPPN